MSLQQDNLLRTNNEILIKIISEKVRKQNLQYQNNNI